MAQDFEDSGESAIPSYLIAADTHNIANRNYSFFETATLGTGAVIGSAATQIYNILPTIGNWFGGDFEHAKTQEVLEMFDSDMGEYYKDHQEGVDAFGFVLSSFVPGTLGVKALRAGQTILRGAAKAGTLGKNMSAATGLLPTERTLINRAVQATLEPNAGFTVWNSATAKAMAAGAGQAMLEGAAFETAVAATMYNSPVLDKQDIGDLATNILWGAGLGGVIGGALHGAKVFSQIKGAEAKLAGEFSQVTHLSEMPHAAKADQILNYLDDLHNTANFSPAQAGDWVGEFAWKATKYESMRAEKIRLIENKVRTLTGELAGGDSPVASQLYRYFRNAPLEEAEAKLFGTDAVSRLAQKSEAERKLDKLVKAAGEKLEFKSPEDEAFYLSREKVYVKLRGEGAGTVSHDMPTVWNLADKLEANGKIGVKASGVKVGDKSWKFALDKVWDATEVSHFEAEARTIWATATDVFGAALEKGKKITIGGNDIPLLEKAYLQGLLPEIAVTHRGKTSLISFNTAEEFKQYVADTKLQMFDRLVTKQKLDAAEAAKIVNVSEEFIAGGLQRGAVEDSMFAFQTQKSKWEASFAAEGRRPEAGEFWDHPTWGKVIKDTSGVEGTDGNVVYGLTAIAEKKKLYEEGAERAVAPIFGEREDQFFRLSDSMLLKGAANRNSVGGGMFTVQNENYGTLASYCQKLGSATLRLIEDTHKATREALNSSLVRLGQNQAAAVEWSVVNAKLRQYGQVAYGFDEEAQAFKPLALMKKEAGEASDEALERVINSFPDDLPLEIPVEHSETVAVIQEHMGLNAARLKKQGAIRANQGLAYNRDPQRFFPIPPNTKDYPFIATVIDDSIGGMGHGKMLYAATAQELENAITAVRASDPTLKVLTRKDAENWYKSIGQYEFERTLTDVTFDSGLKLKGTSSQYLPPTDPQKIINDTLNWHLARDSALVREGVAHLNENQFATLRSMGERFANVQDSHFTKLDPIAYLEMQGKNPYADYVKTALGLSTSRDFPFWTPMNDMLDRKVSGLFNAVQETFKSIKNPDDLEKINGMLRDAGYEGATYSALSHAAANHKAPKGVLTAFVAKANAILSSCMLGLDPINAVNNLVGSNVLRNTELTSLLRNISKGNSEAAGELAKMQLKVPGTGETILSPAKIIAEAMGSFHGEEGRALRELFKSHGIISSRVDQANWVLDSLSLTGKESVQEIQSLPGKIMHYLKQGAEKGETLTGNKLAEEFNRFVSGYAAKKITDLAVKQGVLGEREAWAYINTFVNRVEGNFLAAQRPGIFQGPVGQAIGLFQTYQFNLAQQLLRHVGEGGGKDAALMMGLQSTIYGMKGLPAFDAINTHIIGNASGNKNHRDLYDATVGAAGKDAGEWLLYGVGSNALGLISPELKFNLYTRGDINPRNVTLIPLNPANIPFVQASGKLFSSISETYTKLAQGGNVWTTMLQGIEHAGVNRPLAGLAQTLQAFGNPRGQSFSTSNKGNIVAANDLLSLANMARIAGAKPLDEAAVIDRAYNLEVYAAKDAAKRKTLGETIKTTMIGGNKPEREQVEKFAELYAKYGGRQDKFNQFMMQQYKAANTSQANQLADNLKSPFSQSMQQLMGGTRMRDFSNQGSEGGL